MADLAASDLTYTISKIKKMEDGRKIVEATIAFGDGAKTYPTGGVPVTKAKLGLPVTIDSFIVEDSGASVYSYTVDRANLKLIMFQSPAHSHSLTLKNAAVADGATTRVNAGTNLLGANTGSDITVAGGGANGGVAAVSAGGFLQLTNSVAPAAQSIKITAIGW